MGLQNSVPCWVVGRMTDKLPFGGGRHVAVKDVFDLQMGKTPSRDVPEYWNNGDHEWVSIKDLSSYGKYVGRTKETISDRGIAESRIKLVPANTLIMSFKLSLGKTAITVEPTYTNEAIMAFLDKKTYPIDLCYMYHQFSAKDWGAGTNTAVMGKTLNKKTLGATNICVPSIEVQRGVARRLDFIYSQIELTNQQLAELDSLVKSRFVEMFGDPIENPFGWEAKPLGELGELKNGVNFKSVDSGTDIRCLGVGDFKDRYQISNMELISIVSLNGKPNESQMLRDGDIVFVRSNGNKQLVGRCLAVFPGDEEVTFSGFCIRFRNESDRLLLDYLLGCLKSDSMREAMTGRGANIQNLSQKILSGVVTPIPPIALQQEFAAFVQQVDKLRVVAEKEKQTLQTLYDSLAQEYFAI